MRATILRYATPTITGLFLVSLVSGIALFFHVGGGLFNAMHEWLSMVLILPFVLHLWKNWRALTTYFWKGPMVAALALSLMAAAGFGLASMSGGRTGGPPQIALTHALFARTATEFAPVLGMSGEALAAQLRQAGYSAADPSLPLSAIAARSGKSEFELSSALLQVRP